MLTGPWAMGQQYNRLGYPMSTHYTPEGFELPDQTWCMVQDQRGVVYIGDNEGFVYEYDGCSWRRIHTGFDAVRSMTADSLGRIYVGRVGDFGYLWPNAQGTMEYTSLASRLPDSLRQVGSILSTLIHRGRVYFCSEEYIYELGGNGSVTPIKLPRYSFIASECGGNLFVNNFDHGLLRLSDDGQVAVDPHAQPLVDKGIYAMVRAGRDRYWAITDGGIFEYNQQNMGITPVYDPHGVLRLLESTPGAWPYTAHLLGSGNVGLGYLFSNNMSFVELDTLGGLVSIVNGYSDLRGANIANFHQQGQGPLWLNMADATPVKIDLYSPIKQFSEAHGLIGVPTDMLRVGDALYVGTDRGLFVMGSDAQGFATFQQLMSVEVGAIVGHSPPKGRAMPIAGTIETLYGVTNGKPQPLVRSKSEFSRCYVHSMLLSKLHAGRLYVGSNNALFQCEIRNGAIDTLIQLTPTGEIGDVFGIAEDHMGNIWFRSSIQYLLMLTPTGRLISFGDSFEDGVTPIALNDSLFVLTRKGIMHFDYTDSTFQMGGIAGQRYNGTHVSKIIPYRGGYALQCSTDGNRHRIELLERDSTTGCLVRNAIPFSGLPTKQTPCLYADGDILWMGFKGQLFSYNPHVQYSYSEPFNALIRRVTFKDSLLFDGAYTEQLADGSLAITNAQGHSDVPTMRYSHNAMEVHVGAPFFDYEEATQFAHYLEGSDETTWSAWSNRTSVVYTNLHEGRYTFHVKARNIYGTESTVASFSFRIKPPWYRTIAAFLLYIVVAVLLVWRIVRWNAKRLEAENKRLEAIVQERTAEVVAQKEEIEAQKEVLHEQNREITSSIQYASRIQHTMLSPEEVVTEIFPDNFILYLPRDIVSGDFYVIMQVGNKKISAVADCTGHGVPGGFMSMLGMSSINEIVTKNVNNLHPDVILFKLREKVIHSLHQTGEVGTSKDGMDMALYIVDETEMTLEFAGANNSLVLIRDGEVIQLKADKMPIGFYLKGDIPFTNHKMDLKKGDCIYTFSDGYADQFGGTDGRKFMSKNLRALLLEIHQKPMAEQHDILAHRLVEWHGDSPRIDDVVVMGVRI